MNKTVHIARFGKLLFGLGAVALVALAGCEMEVGAAPEGAGDTPSAETGGAGGTGGTTSSEDCDYPHGSVSGTVTDKNGKPQADCEVSLWSCCAAVYRTQTDANGQYSFPCVGDGPYRVDVWCPGGPQIANRNINVEVDEHVEVNLTEYTFPEPSDAGKPDSAAEAGDTDAGTADASAAFAQCAGLVDPATCAGCCEGAAQSADELGACIAAHCS